MLDVVQVGLFESFYRIRGRGQLPAHSSESMSTHFPSLVKIEILTLFCKPGFAHDYHRGSALNCSIINYKPIYVGDDLLFGDEL